MSTDQHQKMHILIGRLCRICARALSKAMVDGGLHPTSNVHAACASVSRAIVDLWVKDIERPADTTHEPVLDPAILSMMITGTTETFITLAESSFQVNNPDSHHKALQDLSQCARLIELLPEPDVSVIRCLTSTYYSTGVALYQVNKLTMAINFARPSCELPSRFFPILQLDAVPPTWSQYDDSNGELEVLKTHLLKRWELLAICYLQIDRSQAY
ncbi:hypothetical protein PGT21_008269 [Puccinia graminis f. sp. tritici]|uniref:Uncharacterized protein n=1 Tax=Puccinia graminis f. sp. tritici TaxID=56615 RepID=A0A5B0LJ92_PUCGR|nr:hypothetical protein PGTUg99_009113 [Puccinia graminis f. sp. tritici]KAA1065714.1 hypothetical protein PGT21_008269 [Puccinia graminis f. sp. tritici]